MNNASIRDLARNLKVRSILSNSKRADGTSYINTHKIHVTADEIILQDKFWTPLRAAAVDVTVDINASGVNGLDSSAKSPSTWYHMWIISTAGGPAEGLLSKSASEPTLSTPYAYKAYVGAIYNNNNDYFISYYQNNKLAWAEKTCPLPMTELKTTPTSIDLSASVPSTASSVIIDLSGLTTIGGHFISNVYVGPTSNGPWHNQWMMVAGTSQGSGNVDHVQCITQSEILLDTAHTIYAYVETANDLLEIIVLGWKY